MTYNGGPRPDSKDTGAAEMQMRSPTTQHRAKHNAENNNEELDENGKMTKTNSHQHTDSAQSRRNIKEPTANNKKHQMIQKIFSRGCWLMLASTLATPRVKLGTPAGESLQGKPMDPVG